MAEWLFIYLLFTVCGGVYGYKKLETRDAIGNGIFGALIGVLVGLPMSFFLHWIIYTVIASIIAAIWWFLTTFWLPITVVVLLIVGAVYWIRNPETVRWWYECAKARCEAVVAHIKLSDTAIMRYARKQTKKLNAIAPDFEWLDIRTSISELGTRHIAQLLRERKSLRQAIKRIQSVLKQVAWQKHDRGDIEMANARRSAQTVEMLVVKLQQNEADIKETLNTLRHLEADLALATVDIYKRDEIKTQLRGLVSRIQQNTVAVQEARTESDDHAHQRPRRLTE